MTSVHHLTVLRKFSTRCPSLHWRRHRPVWICEQSQSKGRGRWLRHFWVIGMQFKAMLRPLLDKPALLGLHWMLVVFLFRVSTTTLEMRVTAVRRLFVCTLNVHLTGKIAEFQRLEGLEIWWLFSLTTTFKSLKSYFWYWYSASCRSASLCCWRPQVCRNHGGRRDQANEDMHIVPIWQVWRRFTTSLQRRGQRASTFMFLVPLASDFHKTEDDDEDADKNAEDDTIADYIDFSEEPGCQQWFQWNTDLSDKFVNVSIKEGASLTLISVHQCHAEKELKELIVNKAGTCPCHERTCPCLGVNDFTLKCDGDTMELDKDMGFYKDEGNSKIEILLLLTLKGGGIDNR